MHAGPDQAARAEPPAAGCAPDNAAAQREQPDEVSLSDILPKLAPSQGGATHTIQLACTGHKAPPFTIRFWVCGRAATSAWAMNPTLRSKRLLEAPALLRQLLRGLMQRTPDRRRVRARRAIDYAASVLCRPFLHAYLPHQHADTAEARAPLACGSYAAHTCSFQRCDAGSCLSHLFKAGLLAASSGKHEWALTSMALMLLCFRRAQRPRCPLPCSIAAPASPSNTHSLLTPAVDKQGARPSDNAALQTGTSAASCHSHACMHITDLSNPHALHGRCSQPAHD
jgi:hypothetical protein